MENSGKIAKVERERKDWIDKLPWAVLSYILSFLTIKDAVGTCMISHQCRHLWKHPILTRANIEFDILNVFGSKHSQLLEEFDGDSLGYCINLFERDFFVRFVNELLLLYRGKKVDSFKVTFFLDATDTAVLDKWVSFALKKGVEVLDLKLYSSCGALETENLYVFPHWLLSKLSTLKHLSLRRCVLKPLPSQFDGFIQLKTLFLHKAIVDPAFLAHLFSVCLLLESLTFSSCRLGSYLTVGPTPRLSDLKVYKCWRLEKIEIDAVNLSSLECFGNSLLILCIRVPQLVNIILSGWSEGALPFALTQLASSAALQTLYLKMRNKLEDIPQTVPAFRNLKQLNLDIYMQNFDIWSILNFLKAAPRLEEIVITARAFDYQEGARNYPGFSHDHLRIFKMQGFQGKKIEIEFAICILRIATKLELLVIDPLGKSYFGNGLWSELECNYEEENENEVSDEDEEEMFLDEEDGVSWEHFRWKRASLVVRERLREVMSDAQILVL